MPRHDLLDQLGIELPVFQSPMAGVSGLELAVAVSQAGGLGALPWAFYDTGQMRAEIDAFRQRSSRPVNVNFFAHAVPPPDAAREAAWQARLDPYYRELGLDPGAPRRPGGARPFDAAAVEIVEHGRPEVVSFHFGLPPAPLLARVRATGARIMATATTVAEARWLEDNGADIVIAQGFEAGGHRGIFLDTDLTTQIGTLALVPQIVDAVKLPVIAAGGIADARGLAAVLALGAAAGQIGTALLRTPQSLAGPLHRAALADPGRRTAYTNLFTGRPARGFENRLMRDLGPLSDLPPAFPRAGAAVLALRMAAEAQGRDDFSLLNAGQAAPLARDMDAGDVVRRMAEGAQEIMRALASR